MSFRILFAVTMFLLSACNCRGDFEYVGKLSAIVPSTGGSLLTLSGDNWEYELVLHEDTDFTNIKVTMFGIGWRAGGTYGVTGDLNGERRIVEAIGYLPQDGGQFDDPAEQLRDRDCHLLAFEIKDKRL